MRYVRNINLLSCIVFFFCGHLFSQEHTVSDSCKGKLINDLCWAECNVDSPGTFASVPEAYGMLYQWNRKKGWSSTGSVTGWDSSFPIGDSWEAVNDPCPAGWRVPTIDEMATLMDDTKVTSTRTSLNGVYGRKFTDKATGNVIFFPGVSFRSGSDNLVDNPNYNGWYWSSSSINHSSAWILFFLSTSDPQRVNFPKPLGLTVRCVANPDLTVCDSIVKDTSATICASDLPYTWSDTIFQVGTSTGKYRFLRTRTTTGCDSIVYLTLTVNPVYSETFNVSICAGQSYTEHNFNESAAGTYVQNLQSVSGCDSTVTLNLTVNPVAATSLKDSICSGGSYTANGFNASTAGIHRLNLTTGLGCDSVVTLDLKVNPVYSEVFNASVCTGETYTANGFNVNTAGTYYQYLETISGCDSTITLNLAVNPVYTIVINTSICEGQSYTLHNFNESAAGTYVQNLQSVSGCDSTVVLHLKVSPVYHVELEAVICEGEVYRENGFTESTAGTYVRNLQSKSGCDSIVTLHLTVNPSYLLTQNASICEGESYDFRGRILKNTGMYEDVLKTVEGCDSIYRLILTVHPVYDQNLEAVICEGERYTQNGFDESVEGDYVQHLQSKSGCDSIVRLHLRVERYFDGRMNISLQDCRTHTYRFEAESKNAGPGITYSYKWDAGDGTAVSSEVITHSYADSGYYRIGLTVTTGGVCSRTLYDFLKVPYYSNEFTIYSDKESVEPETPTISVWTDCVDGMRYEWDMGDGTTLQDCRVTHTYEIGDKKHYDIRLLVLNVEDCPAEQEFRVMSYKAIKTVNTFSPNGDGLNDVFMAGYKIKIINRNGLIVFEGDNGWDGTCKDASVPEDTYFYEIRYRSELGERVKTGYITVVK